MFGKRMDVEALLQEGKGDLPKRPSPAYTSVKPEPMIHLVFFRNPVCIKDIYGSCNYQSKHTP